MGKQSQLVLSHPHAGPVASGLATALAQEARLAAYFTGLAFGPGRKHAVLRLAAGSRARLLNREHDAVLNQTLRPMPIVELCSRIAARVGQVFVPQMSSYDVLFGLHDRAVAVAQWPPTTAAVYAYEDGARATFERAERQDLARIWDLPTPHHRYLTSLRSEEGRLWPELASARVEESARKLSRKRRELELASAVTVASGFTAASLPDTIGDRPVLVVPYGFPVENFPPKDAPNVGPFLVIAVGSQSVPKGTHYLLEAWKRAGLKDARLRLIGPMRLPERFLSSFRGLFEHLPHVPRALIGNEYRAADLLAFPTLGDGFGLVIQEAMCSATPVLTTPCGGGPECLTDGEDGWIIPPRDIDALVDRLRFASENRDVLVRMGTAARRRAERWNWREAAGLLVSGLTRNGLL